MNSNHCAESSEWSNPIKCFLSTASTVMKMASLKQHPPSPNFKLKNTSTREHFMCQNENTNGMTPHNGCLSHAKKLPKVLY